jgi:ABC-type branched-subunit amino acid transport system ATPase component/ABC-type branched-subunit amino acid transport system permease subunit
MTVGIRARTLAGLAIIALAVWPYLPGIPYDALNTAVLACEYCVAALSLVLLIGLVGQISLCQAALVGMGGFVGALMTRRFGVHFPLTLVVGTLAGAGTAALIGVVALRVRGLYLAVATLIFAYVCDQYLFAQPWLVESTSGTSIPFETIGKPDTIPSFNLADVHVFYYIALAVAAISLYTVANLRDSRIGRAFASIRGSEVAAASLGISVARFKLLGFACAGALAGLGGALTLLGQRTIAPSEFNFTNSLYFLAIAVVGGLRSLGGAVMSSVLFALLVGEVFFRSPALADYLDVISAVLLSLVLLFFRGGLGAIPDRLPILGARLAPLFEALRPRRAHEQDGDEQAQDRTSRRRQISVPGWFRVGAATLRRSLSGVRRSRRTEPSQAELTVVSAAPTSLEAEMMASPLDLDEVVEEMETEDMSASGPVPLRPSPSRELGRPTVIATRVRSRISGREGPDGRRLPLLLRADNVTVRFGGLTAVSEASLRVGAGEIVGLIGPNGAGKTTLFNSVLGLNTPTAGRVELFGKNVTGWDVHRRAALGVGRTFQILQLFPDLSVFDNLLVATHLQNRTGLLGSLFVTPGARRAETNARAKVEKVLRLMQLEHVADRRVAGLPFGTLRLIEVARTLVTGARLVCFDEAASGLDSAETERLIEWFRFLRHLGITLLVIEHDVDMVVRLCDWIYVLDQGRMLADGPPDVIQRDPAVIASYLGAPVEVA